MAKAAVEPEATKTAVPPARGPRSPNFPSIPLSEALVKARVLYDKDKRNSTSLRTVLEHLGFGAKLSGSAGRVLSALRQFGLLEETGGQYRITEGAVRVFTLSDNAPERTAAIQAAAQKPAIYREVLGQYAEGLPSDATLRDFLILKKKFNPDSVDTFIRAFKATIELAKLTPGVYNSNELDAPTPDVSVGDYVQWESQGVLQFVAPKRIVGISEDRGFVFVEGSPTGIPITQLQKVEAPATPHFAKPPMGVAREVSALEEGEAVLQWPATLSVESVQELEDWLTLVIKKLKRRASEKG
jgi:hypothetical protein